MDNHSEAMHEQNKNEKNGDESSLDEGLQTFFIKFWKKKEQSILLGHWLKQS